MKKTLLAIVMLPAMFAVGAANAAFVVSPDNNFNGSLDFNGTITDTAPNWSWEIPAASTALAKDWTAEKIKGIADGENTKFDFVSKGSIPFLQGVMTAPGTNQPGFHPVITVAGTLFEAGTDGMAVQVVASGTKGGTAVANGTFDAKFDIASALAGVWTDVEDGVTYSNNAYSGTTLGAKAFSYLGDAVTKLAAEYPTVDMSAVTKFPATDADRLLEGVALGQNGTSIAKSTTMALSSDLSNMSITFPTASIPDTWTASVPVVVTMK